MAKAPFKISKAPSLKSAASNPAAGLMPSFSWAGVETEAHALVGGGARKTDNAILNAKFGVQAADSAEYN